MVMAVSLVSLTELALRNWWPQRIRVVQSNYDSIVENHDVLGHVLRPNARFVVEGPEYSAQYLTDEQGLRFSDKFRAAPDPSAKRILLLGDSFAFGTGVDYADAWPVGFQTTLRNRGMAVRVLNRAVPAYDTRSEVLLLQELLPRHRPDMVLLAFLPNDLFTNLPISSRLVSVPATKPSSTRRFDTRADKNSRFDIVDLARRFLLSFDRAYVALYGMTARREFFDVPVSPPCRRQIDVTKELLAEAARACRRTDTPMVVLSLPQQFQVIVKAGGFTPGAVDVEYIDRTFGEFADKQGFLWISALEPLSQRYKRQGKDLYYRLDGHLNAEGNAFVGSWLADAFMARLGHAL